MSAASDVKARADIWAVASLVNVTLPEKTGVKFSSPFRPDAHPSCELWRAPNGDVLIRDRSTGETFDSIRLYAHTRGITDGKAIAELANKFSLSAPALPIPPRPAPKPVDLHARILKDYPACVASLADSSPVVCDKDEDEARAFLGVFPADAVLWIGKDIYQTGKPEHAKCFRTRAEWEAETFTAPGMRIAPASFKSGSFSRGAESIAKHLFTVIESDEIGEGEKYADKDQFCALIQWLREACGWHLAAVVDSGNRSLHAWFTHPGATDMELLEKHAAALGLDTKFSEPSQPWRLPGVKREGSDTRQQLLYLDRRASI